MCLQNWESSIFKLKQYSTCIFIQKTFFQFDLWNPNMSLNFKTFIEFRDFNWNSIEMFMDYFQIIFKNRVYPMSEFVFDLVIRLENEWLEALVVKIASWVYTLWILDKSSWTKSSKFKTKSVQLLSSIFTKCPIFLHKRKELNLV